MSKERFLRIYTNLSVLIGIFVLATMFFYIRTFPASFNGLVTKTLFKVTLETNGEEFIVNNTPLYSFLTLVVLNLVIGFNIRKVTGLEKPILKEATYINLLLSVLLVVGQIIFFVSIPDQINGDIIDKYFYVNMPRLSDDIAMVFNTNYLLAVFYILYNMYVSIRTIPKIELGKDELEIDEELYAEEFYANLARSEYEDAIEGTITDEQEDQEDKK